MAVKTTLEEIEQDISDVVKTNFTYSDTKLVPNSEDGGLNYERGTEKRGKRLYTCVLYVDIRNSIALTEKHHSLTMGKIYTAFTKAVLKVGRHHNGHTRNIIGDRIMIVFPEDGCFTNAVNCAISINHISKFIMAKQFPAVKFSCGVGIDYGELRIIKVGIQRNGTERGENKGLIWAGYPANIASRLTDNASKTVDKTYYEVIRNPINPMTVFPYHSLANSLLNYYSVKPSQQPLYLSTKEMVRMSPEEFAEKIVQSSDGSLYMSNGNLISFTKKQDNITYMPILMTEAVYDGFRRLNGSRKCIVESYWTEQKHEFKNVNSKVYGGDVYWNL